jgi:hypothetical protein
MKIPTHWKEQHAPPENILNNTSTPQASDFLFLLSQGRMVKSVPVPLSPEDEGRMLFFPSTLNHQVYPFYECEEERITISGNIVLEDLNTPKETLEDLGLRIRSKIPGDEYEEKKNMLKMMENDVEMIKKELEWMEKN